MNFDGLIERVALDGCAAGFPNGFHQFGLGLHLGLAGTRHFEDVLLKNGPVDVISAVAQGDLCELEPEPDPIGGDVRKVIEVNAADRNRAQRIKSGRLERDGELVIRRLVREGDEANEPVRLILKRAELAKVIDAVGKGFDVAVKHCAGAALAHLMPGAMDIEVFGGGFLPLGDSGADGRFKDFRAAAG